MLSAVTGQCRPSQMASIHLSSLVSCPSSHGGGGRELTLRRALPVPGSLMLSSTGPHQITHCFLNTPHPALQDLRLFFPILSPLSPREASLPSRPQPAYSPLWLCAKAALPGAGLRLCLDLSRWLIQCFLYSNSPSRVPHGEELSDLPH